MMLDLLKATAADLRALQTNGTLSCLEIVRAYHQQIHRHDAYLRATIETVPLEVLERIAIKLDDERRSGKVRSPLHGIPLVVKDTFNTGPEFQVNTTCGSLAFIGSNPFKNATVVQRAVDAGMVLIAKANVSELGYFKGPSLVWGWSAAGGQAQSPYVDGNVEPSEGVAGHSNPGGSSTGSASAVAAGYAPISIGADFTGSLTHPASRAALYTLRPTPQLILEDGCYPYSKTLDSVGPLAKSVEDVVDLFNALVDCSNPKVPRNGYGLGERRRWSDMSIATLSPDVWFLPQTTARSSKDILDQVSTETRDAYSKLRSMAKKVVDEVELVHGETLTEIQGKGRKIIYSDFKEQFENYVKTLQTPRVSTLQDLVNFNRAHADKELPQGYADQRHLIRSANAQRLPPEEHERLWRESTMSLRMDHVERLLREHSVDIILGPADSRLPIIVGFGGLTSATLPLGYLRENGRPFALLAVARQYDEELLIDVMRQWEQTFPPRKAPLPRAL